MIAKKKKIGLLFSADCELVFGPHLVYQKSKQKKLSILAKEEKIRSNLGNPESLSGA